MTKLTDNLNKPFSSIENYQFVCTTCGDQGVETESWPEAQRQAVKHKKDNPTHDVDILILHTITSRNNFKLTE